MSEVEEFLSIAEEEAIIDAIRVAEKNTSGEIRVHIESSSEIEPLERAKEIFHLLKMDNTKRDNAVLFYVAVKTHRFAIFGDKGIHKVVPPNFWESIIDILQVHFKKGAFAQGLVDGILKAGEQLKLHFPLEIGDRNELNDSISKG